MGAVEAADAETVWAVYAGSGRRESDPEMRRAMAGPRWIAGPARGGEVVAGKDADILAAREGGGGGVCVEGKGGKDVYEDWTRVA